MIGEDENAWLPDLLYCDGRFLSGVALVSDDRDRIARAFPISGKICACAAPFRNARFCLASSMRTRIHFQRAIRGRTGASYQRRSRYVLDLAGGHVSRR